MIYHNDAVYGIKEQTDYSGRKPSAEQQKTSHHKSGAHGKEPNCEVFSGRCLFRICEKAVRWASNLKG